MTTNKHESGPLSAGWRLVWQTSQVLWWIYAVNLVLGFFSAVGFAARVGSVLDHSLAAQRLYHGFDLASFVELAAHPDVQLRTRTGNSWPFLAVFFIFMLFASGGILETYARHRRLVPGEFFQACGAFFWRFVGLLACLVLVLVPLLLLTGAVVKVTDRLSVDAASEKLGFWVEIAALAVILLAMMSVRLWFDMAQIRAVVEDEHGMLRTLARTFRPTFRNFGSLFPVYLVPSLAAWAGTALAFVFWVELPAERYGMAFLAGQFIAFIWITTRLWQRASETVWYQRRRPAPEGMLIRVAEESAVAPPVQTPQRVET